jgi:hypothetical protein
LTGPTDTADNPRVLRTILRTATWLTIAPALAFGWKVAPAHEHHGDAEHRAGGIIHSHVAPHQPRHPHGLSTAIDNADDDDVVWLDETSAPQTFFRFPVPLTVPVATNDLPPSRPTWFPKTQDDPAPAHGPPRVAHAFRGPPRLLLSNLI